MPRLRGGGKKVPVEETIHRFFHGCKRGEPNLTNLAMGLIEDEFGVTRKKSWVSTWWKRDYSERKAGSGGHNRISDVNRRKVLKLAAGWKKAKLRGVKRKLNNRECSRER